MSIVFKNECASCIDTPLCNKTTMYVDKDDGAVKVIDNSWCVKTLWSIEQLDACVCCINDKVNSIWAYLWHTSTSWDCVPDWTKFIKIYMTIWSSDYNSQCYFELTNEKRSYWWHFNPSRWPWSASAERTCDNTIVFWWCMQSKEAYFYW